MNEIWKEVKGFPYYEISNLGNLRCKAYDKVCIRSNGSVVAKHFKERPVKIYIDRKNKWPLANLSVGCDRMHVRAVHRLVADAFVPNPNNSNYVRHLDGDLTNNKATNLIWLKSSITSLPV